MTRPLRSRRTLWSDVDLLGRYELLGLFVYLGTAAGFVWARFVGAIRDERTISTTSLLICAGLGVIAGLAAVVGAAWSWRRRGGRSFLRLCDRAIRGGELPESLALRIRILRELERREDVLDKQTPAVVSGGLWTILAVLQISTDHSTSNTVLWVLIWGFFAANSVSNLLDRRRRPELRRVIDHLREHPLEALPRERASSS